MVAEKKRDPHGYGVKLLDRNKVDFDHVKSWIKACQYHHYQECRLPRNFSRVLRVIDCQTEKLIIMPDGSEYLALSYVWGKRRPPIWDSRRLKSPFDLERPPRVVKDAIAVTLELGYQYLWVDKYCIDQTDVAGKMAEIAVMDQICESARLPSSMRPGP
jgi:hypothetical protein